MFRVIVTCDGCVCNDNLTKPMSYEECKQYIREHIQEFERKYEEWYSLDILNVDSGRLVSWVL
jgi:hypothetical protein